MAATFRSTSEARLKISSGHLHEAPEDRPDDGEVPEDLQNLDEQLSDTYFCNFSLFQSIPDSWAIKQLFPVVPDSPAERTADQPRRAWRHHLRLRRKLDRFVDRATSRRRFRSTP